MTLNFLQTIVVDDGEKGITDITMPQSINMKERGNRITVRDARTTQYLTPFPRLPPTMCHYLFLTSGKKLPRPPEFCSNETIEGLVATLTWLAICLLHLLMLLDVAPFVVEWRAIHRFCPKCGVK